MLAELLSGCFGLTRPKPARPLPGHDLPSNHAISVTVFLCKANTGHPGIFGFVLRAKKGREARAERDHQLTVGRL
jgi:hypothetical protein